VKSVATAKTARKRNRKRKRRVASSESSSSSSEDTSSSAEDENPSTVKLKTQVSAKPVVSEDPSSSSESSESEQDSSSEAGSDHEGDDVEMLDASVPNKKYGKQDKVVYSRSPSPTPAPVPSFLPTKPDGSVDTEGEQQLKDRFRKFWMQSVADAFQDDLVQIHKVGGHKEKSEMWTHHSSPHLGARYEQIPAGNARGLFGFRRGCFYVKLFCGESQRERDGHCYE